jgi:iron-sulfur cluster repair protein YtfE (RIC family)
MSPITIVNAAKWTSGQSEMVEQVIHEHHALCEKVKQIHTVLAEPIPNKDEIESLLRDFMTALIFHFSNEEMEDGLFAEVSAHSPRLAGKVAKLGAEHRQLVTDVHQLCRFASAGSPSMPWWRELSSRCHGLTKRLMQHEHDENALLQEAHQADIGAYD